MEKVKTSLSLDANILDALKRLAKQNNRNISGQLQELIIEACKKHGVKIEGV